jgi:hypothetical protein
MAKADEEEFAPRKTTTYNKFEGMASQNERYNVKQQELFWLENIMRTAPHKLSSVPGPTLKAHFPGWLPPPWHIIPPGSCPTCPCLTTDQGDPNILIAHSAIATVPCSRFIQTETCADIVQFSQARFENVVVGNPLSGPTVRVLAGSTPTVFTGYGLIYDPGATTLSIVKWLAAPLITMGTVLSSQSATLNPGDVLALIAQTVGGANQLLALINGVLQAALTVTDSDIATTNLWAGFIVVGNTGADDRMEWDLLSADCSSIPIPVPLGCPDFAGSAFIESLDFVIGNHARNLDPAFVGPPVTGNPPNWIQEAGTLIAVSQSSGLNFYGVTFIPTIGNTSVLDHTACGGVGCDNSCWLPCAHFGLDNAGQLALQSVVCDTFGSIGTVAQDVVAVFGGIISGNPISGPAIGIDGGSIADAAILICAVYDTTTIPPEIKVIQYSGGSLANTGNGTILGTIPGVLFPGDLISILLTGSSGMFSAPGNAFAISVSAPTGNFDTNCCVDDASMVANSTHGFVVIGSNSGNACDEALWSSIYGENGLVVVC